MPLQYIFWKSERNNGLNRIKWTIWMEIHTQKSSCSNKKFNKKDLQVVAISL